MPPNENSQHLLNTAFMPGPQVCFMHSVPGRLMHPLWQLHCSSHFTAGKPPWTGQIILAQGLTAGRWQSRSILTQSQHCYCCISCLTCHCSGGGSSEAECQAPSHLPPQFLQRQGGRHRQNQPQFLVANKLSSMDRKLWLDGDLHLK